MQAINPINTHTKFGKDRTNTFPSNVRKPSVRKADAGKSKNNMSTPTGVDIITAVANLIAACATRLLGHL